MITDQCDKIMYPNKSKVELKYLIMENQMIDV